MVDLMSRKRSALAEDVSCGIIVTNWCGQWESSLVKKLTLMSEIKLAGGSLKAVPKRCRWVRSD